VLKKEEIRAQRFEADQEGIDDLKNEFLDEAHHFVYFRKGRWSGFEASVCHVAEWTKANPEIFLTAASSQPISDKILDDVANAVRVNKERVLDSLRDYYEESYGHREVITFRVLVVEGALSELDIARWERISDLRKSIVTVPSSQEGYFRFLVNEKRYAIFCRVNKDLLQGIIGYDTKSIDLLRYQFDLEFYVSALESIGARVFGDPKS
jgi:hypothetical protein